jgi:Tol biopolymer transport system component
MNAAVNKLRDALCDSADDPKYIETLPRRGYRFIATVERSAAEVVEPSVVSPPPPPPLPAIQVIAPVPPVAPTTLDEPVSVPRRRWRRYLVPALAVLFAFVFVIGHLLMRNPEQEEKLAAERGKVRPAGLLTSLADATSDPAFSPDGNRVAFRRMGFVPGTSGIWVKQIDGDELTQVTTNESDRSPAWSPDGHSIAFARSIGSERKIYSVPASGGGLRELASLGPNPKHSELDWSPDADTIAFAAETPKGNTAIFLLSVQDSKSRQITSPSDEDSDWGAAFSPDGSTIAFVRTRNSTSNIMLMPAAGGEVRRVPTDSQQVDGAPAWTADGASIVFAARDADTDRLWRVPVARGVPTEIAAAGFPAWSPAISRRGFRLAYLRMVTSRSIGQIDLTAGARNSRGLITSVGGQNAGPQISPDGKRLVYMSDRAGGMDIWVSDRDGQNPLQLTAVGTAGAPRWSPDGKTIAFDVGLGLDWKLPRAIFLVSADGGVPRTLVQDAFNNPAPSWSRDGAWIYFPSDRSGKWQLWKVPSHGGTPVQVTMQGGFAAWEAPDYYLYYAKDRDDGPELWRVPVGGGAEAPVFPRIQPLDWADWAVTEKGIFFVATGPQGFPVLNFFDFSTMAIKRVAAMDQPPFWLGAQADGSSVVFDVPGNEASHVMVLENFR